MSNMLINSNILIPVIEQTNIAFVRVKLDDSILWEAYDVARYVIVEILPYAAVIILILVIVILMRELISRLFR